ncbi:MAG: class IV adenylate cyclase [Candidatus Nanohaloarchaea archaeon]|nr:class IV adenylate cyclase [Candidatus Nanohaloarchaea archaeon]
MAQQELRATIDDPDDVAERLIEEAGAREIDVIEQRDTYFGLIDLYEDLGRFFLVRVREQDSTMMINYKSELEDGMWEEYETIINDPEAAKKIFERMGLDRVLEVSKTRRSYRLDGMRFHIDSIEDLGHFIEVKLDPDQTSVEEAKEVLASVGVEEQDMMENGYVTTLLRRKDSEYAEWCST